MAAVTAAADVPPLLVRAMGEVVAIEVPDQETRDRLAHQWSRAVVQTDAPAAATVHAVSVDAGAQAANDYALTARVTLAALEVTRGRRLNLHAGGLADVRRRVLALVAASGTGKTTATRTLAERLGYVSDETVSIDPDGTVAPHPKPLSVVVDPERWFSKEQLSPDDLGLLPTPDEGRLARLVVLHRGGDGPRGLSRLGAADGLLQLIEQSSSLAEMVHPLRTLQAIVDECQGVWALTYDEIADHVDDLVDLLADVPPDPGPQPALAWHDGAADFPLVPARPGEDGPLLARLPWAEAVEVDDDVVVLTQSRAWLLTGLTATVWLHLGRPCSYADLVRAAELRHGPHEQAGELVLAAVRTLEQEELVAWGTMA
jgi:hypothetical protein